MLLASILNFAVNITNITNTNSNLTLTSQYGLIALFVTLLGVFIISELVEEGIVSFFGLIIAICILYFVPIMKIQITDIYSGIGLKNIIIFFILYLVFGLIYGLIRSYYYAKDYKYSLSNNTSKELLIEIRNNHLFRWIFLFPFSLILWGISKWLKSIYFKCFEYIKSLLLKIIELGLKSK